MSIIRGAGIVAAALSAMAAVASPAFAAGDTDMTTYVRIDRAAVTPASEAQAQRSLNRLGSKALEACGASFFSLREYREAVRKSECWNESMASAVAQIDNPYLTAAFGRHGTVEVAENQGGSATHAR